MEKVLSLREARAERVLTIRDLAELAGVSPSTIYMIEAGRSMPKLSMVRRLALALDIQPQTVSEFSRSIEASKAQGRPGSYRRHLENGQSTESHQPDS